ncbi:MAG TPA: hypothetical protein VIE91_04120 [Methylophilaceae bacterium]|jgi:hypothetical protein
MKADPKYIEMALKLSGPQKERLLSRMTGKLPKRLLKDKIDIDEAIAIQLEIEDEQLQEWRKQMQLIKNKSKKVAEEKDNAAKMTKLTEKANSPTKPKQTA